MKFSEYQKLKPLAVEIYRRLLKEPVTSQEIANKYNLIGGIIEEIHKHQANEA